MKSESRVSWEEWREALWGAFTKAFLPLLVFELIVLYLFG